MPSMRVLIVDDEPDMLEVCRDTLSALGRVELVTEVDSRRAADMLAESGWDLLITDIRMAGLSGVELLEKARHEDAELPVLMMTAYPTVETAVESMKLGAADYITKPFIPEDLLATARRLLESRRLDQENRLLKHHLERRYAFGEMVGRSAAMAAVFETIERVAETDVDVLILGETGTGKELVARTLHERSSREGGHFVPVDCGAIPEDLLESEFFGHERGAFTGAASKRLGLLEFASGGTLFLDEVDHLSLKLQAKLLRALQERRIRRVGGVREFDVNTRVVAASSAELGRLVREERFRSDLYYRINVAPVELPPLRRHPDDVPLLADHFVARYAREMGRDPVGIEDDALEVLTAYPWPGNVRELQNVIKRVLAMARPDVIRVEDLPDEVIAGAGMPSDRDRRGYFGLRDQYINAFERDYLVQQLRQHEGDVTSAAADAQLPRGTLYRLLKKQGLDPADFRDSEPPAV
ncbi:MAG: sigma-54 dependent transcriptional regulator [Gemmatimonadota bacterium]